MQKQTPFKIISILIVLATLIIPVANQPAWAQEVTPDGTVPSLEVSEESHWVVRVYFTDRQQVDQIAAWIEPWEVNYDQGYLVIGVTEQEFNLLQAQGYQLEIDEVLTELYNRPLEYLPGQINAIPGYPCYRTVEETYTTAYNLATDYPDLAEWMDIGDSWEKADPGGLPGYEMMVLRLTNENIPGDKPKLFVMAAIHAREYTTAELVTRFAEYLINNYDVDPDVTWLLDYTEIHLLLQSNPDGRKIAETGDLWRKNTDNDDGCSNPSSWGTDLNRNFYFQWGGVGSSGDPCYTTYRGPAAASEPETQAVQNYVASIFPDQRGPNLTDPAPDDATGLFMDIHSSGEWVLWPWGFTGTVPPNGTQLQTLGRKFAYFNNYYPVQAIGLYPTTGTTDDFAYGDLGLAAYTFELGTQFFQSCSVFENTILPTNLPALVYAAKVSRTPYMTPAGPDALNVTATPDTIIPGELVTLNATINETRYSNQNGTEPTQNIAAAVYYVDTPPWETGAITLTMSAADGNFNSPIENVTANVNTTGFSPGRHIIFVRGQDAAGNWGAVSAVFVVYTPPQASFISSSPDELGSATVFTNTSTGTDLSYEWDFGDLSAISFMENPTHTYTTTGAFTVTLTVTDGITADTYSDQVYIYDPADAQILLDKNVSASEIQPGEWMTYTLDAQLVFTGTNPFSLALTDTLPAEVIVLTDSIQLNGLPAPDLYISDTHSILYQASGTFTDTHEVGITFQVQVGSEVISGTLITNRLDGQATINGEPTLPPQTAETTTLVILPWRLDLFLPVVMR